MEALNLDTPSSQPRRFCHIFAGVYAPLLAKDSETEGPEVGLQEFRQIGTGKR
jgi:hypothetical protein